MNQSLIAGVDAPAALRSLRETPTLLAPAARPGAADGLTFIGEVRTHLTTILGFSAMLSDPGLDLTDQKRAEYGMIVETSGALLAERLKRRSDELLSAS